MAFTRKFLAALGIDAEKAEEIMSAHVEVTEALKAQIAETKDSSEELAKVTAQLEQAKNDLKTANDKISAAEKDDYKGKYESEKAAREKLESEYAAKKTESAQKKALSDYLKQLGYSDSSNRLIVNKSDFASKVELDGDKALNLDSIVSQIQADDDFSGFTPKSRETHHEPQTPPANAGGQKAITKDEIMKIQNAEERQQKIDENRELFNLPPKN